MPSISSKTGKKMRTNQQFTNCIHSVNTSVRTINRIDKVRVQPTSISRRKGNVTRGLKRIPERRKLE